MRRAEWTRRAPSSSFLKPKRLKKRGNLPRHARQPQPRTAERFRNEITELALQIYLDTGGSANQTHVAVVAGEGWHRGVIGLAASRITEKLYRPSARHFHRRRYRARLRAKHRNYHLLNALDSCGELFEKYGGHAAACGFKIKAGKYRFTEKN